MNPNIPFDKKKIWLRILVVLILSTAIWTFITYLTDIFIGQDYSQINHFSIAVITTALTTILILTALRFDNIGWQQIGQGNFKINIHSFLLGFFLWNIPAGIGLLVCLMFGWVDMEMNTDLNNLLWSLIILFITVFLIEALPEELIFRGYIYRYLNILFPHWATILLQALLFSVFAYFIGAMYSLEQMQFIPGFAIILGVFRAISGSVWTSIGFHVAIMTATQILGPVHDHFEVSGMPTLQFFAFILLPSVIGSIVLSFMRPDFNWRKTKALN